MFHLSITETNIQPCLELLFISMMGPCSLWNWWENGDYGLICSFDNHFIFPLSVFSSMRLWWVCYILIILAVFSFTLSLVHFLLACINILFSLKISPGLSDLLIALYQFTALFFSNQLTSIWKCQCATSLRLPVNIWYLIIWTSLCPFSMSVHFGHWHHLFQLSVVFALIHPLYNFCKTNLIHFQ